MIASKGFVLRDPEDDVGDLVRSVVEDESRSVALIPSAEEELAAA